MEFRILGPLEIVRDGEPLVLRAAKHRSLLAVLVLHANEVVPYERMFDELWGERPPATARTTLQVYVSGLRKALGPDRIVSHARGYLLHAEREEVDAARFQRLVAEAREQVKVGADEEAAERFRHALALWRGPALADVALESFARNEVERLEELRLAALAERVECELRGGREAEVLGELEALVGEHPLNERFRAQLMLALYRQGRQAEALEAYRKARRTLVEELGIEPGPELHELNRKILEQDPSLAPLPHGALPSGTVTLLASDVEGSTELLQELGPRYAELLREEQSLLRSAFTLHGGREVDSQGESFLYAFPRASAAALAAAEAQRALADQAWPEGAEVRVRVGIHTGEPALVEERFVGLDVHRVARICAAGHGGQILLSREARELVKELPGGIALRDLGAHRLKDLREPERLFQLSVPGLRDDFPPLRSLHATNIPTASSSFVGRERELAELRTLLLDPKVRLLSLTGAGGSGKTRLALELAAALLPAFPDGAFFVSLASLSEPAFVLPTIAQTLSLKEIPGQTVAETLERSLAERELLLVLDNFEHLLPAAAELAALLQGVPRLKLLVTSRAALRLSAEQLYEVHPLALPDLGDASPLEELARAEAVLLFCERARAVRPQFELAEANAREVAEICVRLDGLPLALELAAARATVLSPAALLSRLDRGLELLSAGARDRPPRQQTMRATIEWSERLLEEPERTLFRRLSVFAGGFGAEAAEAVCRLEGAPELDTFEGLSSLVEKSLLRQEEGQGEEPRFSMLESVREYAGELFANLEEREHTRHAHAEYYAALGHRLDEELWLGGRDRIRTTDELAQETDNLYAAMAWAREADSRLELTLATAYQVSPRVGPGEGRRLLEDSLARAGTKPSRARARALAAVGGLAVKEGDSEQARASFEESLALYRHLEDRRWTFVLLRRLSGVTLDAGDLEGAKQLAEEADEIARNVGIDERAWAPMSPTDFAFIEGDFERAYGLLSAELRLRTEAGDEEGIMFCKHGLAVLALHSGQLDAALAGFEEALEWACKRQYREGMRVFSKWLAAALGASGEVRPAATIFAATEAWRRARGFVVREWDARSQKRYFGALYAALETEAYADEAAAGSAMSLEEAAELALGTVRRVRAAQLQ